MDGSPKPLAAIVNDEYQKYTTKKEQLEAGLSLKTCRAPKPPPKPTLPYMDTSTEKALSVSFKENSLNNLSLSYNDELESSYIEQCFSKTLKIGEGSFGVVYRAKSVDDGRWYAVKKSKQRFTSNYDKRIKLAEVKKHENVPRNPHCIQMYRAWMENNRLFLQLELCATTLEKYANEEHNIPESYIWRIFLDLSMAVKNLHDANLIHLDIKLENIMMTSTGTCKLGDFGLLLDLSKKRKHYEEREGDSKYIAPELLRGHFTKAADIFSLGVVILELSCDLVLPGNGRLWHELRSNKFPEHLMKDLSPELTMIIKSMMSSDYLHRPTIDELLNYNELKQLRMQRSFVFQIQAIIRSRLEFVMVYLIYLYKLPSWVLKLVMRSLVIVSAHTSNLKLKSPQRERYSKPTAVSTPIACDQSCRIDLSSDASCDTHRSSNIFLQDSGEKDCSDLSRKRRYESPSSEYLLCSSQTPRKYSRFRQTPVGRKLFKVE